MVTWSCLGFYPYLEILVVTFDSKLTIEDHVHCIVSSVFYRIGILRLVKRILVDTSVLLRSIWHLFSQSSSIVLRCGGQLLNITFSFLSAKCIQWPGFFPIRVSCRCAIDVVWLDLVWCTTLIRTLITVCSASFHLFLLDFDIPKMRSQLIHWSMNYQGVERPNLLGFSCRLRFECGMTFPTLFDSITLDGFKGAVNRWLLPWVVLFFRGVDACGVTKAIYKQLCFSHFCLYC